jgi:uroporphyrinogen-III synthase
MPNALSILKCKSRIKKIVTAQIPEIVRKKLYSSIFALKKSSNMKILFTRTIESHQIQKLEALGHHVNISNLLQINVLKTAQNNILQHINDIKNLVFTSKHAAYIFFDVLKKENLQLSAEVKIFSTSGETQNTIKKYGYSPTLSAPSAAPLAQLMVSQIDLSQGVYFFAGTLSLPILPNFLLKNDIKIQTITIYETVKNSFMHPLSNFDALSFFSLSAVDAFLLKNTIPEQTIIFTLGSTTAQHLEEKTGAKHIFVASKPTIDSLIDKIIEIFK